MLPPSAEASSGPNVHPELTFRLLEPLGVFSKLQQCAPMSLSVDRLELRNVFQTCFQFVSQREHYIFLEGVDWCHILLHKEGT